MSKGKCIGRWHLLAGVLSIGGLALSLSYQGASAELPKSGTTVGITTAPPTSNRVPQTREEILEANAPWITPDSAMPISAEMLGVSGNGNAGGVAAVACTCAGDCETGNQCTRGACQGRVCALGTFAGNACDDFDDQISCTNGGGTCGLGTCVNSNVLGGTICDLDATFCTREECDGAGACAAATTKTCDGVPFGTACTVGPDCPSTVCTVIPTPRCAALAQTCDESNDVCLTTTGPVAGQDKGRCCAFNAADTANNDKGQQTCLNGATLSQCNAFQSAPRRWYPTTATSACPCPRYSSGVERPGLFLGNTERASSCGALLDAEDHIRIGDDYALSGVGGTQAANTHLLLKRIRWVGGTETGGENNRVSFQFYDSSGNLVNVVNILLGQSGIFVYDITLQIPFIIPPTGFMTVKSPFFFPSIIRWAQTTSGPDNDFVAGLDPAVDVGANAPATVWLDNGSAAAADIVPPAATATGILGFELSGDPVAPPTGACCTGLNVCGLTVEWLCAGEFKGAGSTCIAGTCSVGACCRATGVCNDGQTPGTCSGGDVFNGFGSICDELFNRRDAEITSTPSLPVPGWNCCNGTDLTGNPAANTCTTAHNIPDTDGTPLIIDVPPVGNAKGITVHDDNTGATGGSWWLKFTITDHANVTLDFCCSDPAIGPTQALLFPTCPTGAAIGSTRSERGVTCRDDNVTMVFHALEPGTYYYEILSEQGISRPVGGFTAHLTVEGLPKRVCCDGNVCQGVCDNDVWPTVTLCTPADGTNNAACGGTPCVLPNENECHSTAIQGHFKPIDGSACSPTICSMGSCCGPDPGSCNDNGGAGVLPAACTGGQTFVGGSRCEGDAGPGFNDELVPCPICEVDRGLVNCQRNNAGTYGQSDRFTGLRKADDFVAQCTAIDTVCWTGNYQNYVETVPRGGNNIDCACLSDDQDNCVNPGAVQTANRPFGTDSFEIRIYAEDPFLPGLPGALLATRTQADFTSYVQNNLDKEADPKPSFDQWEYTASFPAIAGLAIGGTYFLEVTNSTPPNIPAVAYSLNCNWSWYESGDGNAYSLSDGSPPYDPSDYANNDNNFCLGAPGGLACGILTPDEYQGACWPCPPQVSCAVNTLSQCLANSTSTNPQNWLGVGSTCLAGPVPPTNQPPVPTNDLCGTPQTITSQVTATDNRCTILLADGPGSMTPCPPQGNSVPIEADVWYKYTATCSGRLTTSMCLSQSGGQYDAVLGIYGPGPSAGNPPACPVLNSINIGCNDDGCSGIFGPPTASAIVITGETYLIRVGGFAAQGFQYGTGFLETVCTTQTCVAPAAPSLHTFITGDASLTCHACATNANCNPVTGGNNSSEGVCLNGCCHTPYNRYLEFSAPPLPAGATQMAFRITMQVLPGPDGPNTCTAGPNCTSGVCNTTGSKVCDITPFIGAGTNTPCPLGTECTGGETCRFKCDNNCPRIGDYSAHEGDIVWASNPGTKGVSTFATAATFRALWKRCSGAGNLGGGDRCTVDADCPAGETCAASRVTIGDAGVVPCATYKVEAITDVCPLSQSSSFSPALLLKTPSRPMNVSGSNSSILAPPDSAVAAVGDVTWVLDRFKGAVSIPPHQRPRVDMCGNCPNNGSGRIPPSGNNVSVSDVTCTLDAFKGLLYHIIVLGPTGLPTQVGPGSAVCAPY